MTMVVFACGYRGVAFPATPELVALIPDAVMVDLADVYSETLQVIASKATVRVAVLDDYDIGEPRTPKSEIISKKEEEMETLRKEIEELKASV